MIENAQHLFSERDYDFYLLDEIGFSNKSLGLRYHLYEDFGPDWDSVFNLIYQGAEFANHRITQIWIYHHNEPVGICMGIHHRDFDNRIITHRESGLQTDVIGHIQLYVRPAHRGQGLAALAIPQLEKNLLERETQYPPSIVMEGKAWRYNDKIKESLTLPYGIGDPLYFRDNPKFLCPAFKAIFECNERLMKMLEKYQTLSSTITDLTKTKTLVADSIAPKIKLNY